MFCNKCGTQVPEGSKFCQACGSSVSPTSLAPDSMPPPGRAFGRHLARQGISHATSSLVAAGGAILMLIALAVPWYTLRASDGTRGNVSLGILLNPKGSGNPNWAGSGLPVVIIIVCASVSLLFVGYALMTGSQQKKLWAWLGSLSVVCALANLGYILWWTIHTTNAISNGEVSAYITPHAGFLLAFFGAIALVASSAVARKNPTAQVSKAMSQNSASVEDELKRLKELHDTGAITAAEYQEQKNKLLQKL